jgi:hypothetical protein
MTCRAASTGQLGASNTVVLLRLLPMSDRDRDAEALVLRHQITVLERQVRRPSGRVPVTISWDVAGVLAGVT